MRRSPHYSGDRTIGCIAFSVLAWTASATIAAQADSAVTNERQSLEDAWWTGPLLTAGASPLPQGRFLIEPYLFDVHAYGRYDADGTERDVASSHFIGSQSYLLYGVTDRFTAGLIPRFGFSDVSTGADSSGIRVGDLTVQLQYGLTQFREGTWLPTTSLVLQETLPTGKYDRLGERLSDGVGAGVYTTSLALHSQTYLWMPNGRILRTRLNLAYAFSNDVRIEDESVYGTSVGFRGHAAPGDTFTLNSAWEYSATHNWVLALDVYYQHDDPTRVRGDAPIPSGGREPIDARSGSSWQFGLAPAVEYNWTSQVGVIVGARWIAAGRNATASITPAVAINIVL